MSNYFSLITELGLAKTAKAQANGKSLKLVEIAIGDANGDDDAVPAASQTKLVNEVYRANINRLFQSDKDSNVLIAELNIPSTVGGFVIREVGVFDEEGDLFAIGRYPATVKPKLSDGIARDEIIQMALVHAGSSHIELSIDPSIVMASRAFVDDSLTAHLNDQHPHPQYVLANTFQTHIKKPNPYPQYCLQDEFISKAKVLNVGKDKPFKTLQSAWDSVSNKIIRQPIKIQLDEGEHQVLQPITLTHPPLGAPVFITGNNKAPDKTVLKAMFKEDKPIISVLNVEQLYLSGLTITGTQPKEKTGLSTHNSVINSAPKSLVINQVKFGVIASHQSSLTLPGIIVKQVVCGLTAQLNSQLSANKARVICMGQNYVAGTHRCIGLNAHYHSQLIAEGVNVSNACNGVCASQHGTIIAIKGRVSHCYIAWVSTVSGYLFANSALAEHSLWGYYASDGSHAQFDNAQVVSCQHGYYASVLSSIRAMNTSTKTSNCPHPFQPPLSGSFGNVGGIIYRS